MPTLRYYDGAAYQPLPGMPGATGPAGPVGPTGPQGSPGPGVTNNYVASAWLGASTTSSSVMSLTATALQAGHSYLVMGYAVAYNTSAATATARASITTAAANGAPGPNAGTWIFYEANVAADESAVGAYSKGTIGSFIYTPAVTGDVVFTIFSVGTAGAFTFAAGNAAIFVMDMTGVQGPIGATGATGPAGPAGGGSVIASLRAIRLTAYTIPTAVTPFVWETVQWDTQSAYNASTGVYTCPVAGKYHVSAQIVGGTATAVGQWLGPIVQKNGANQAQNWGFASATGANQWLFGNVVCTLDCAVGDTITVASQASVSCAVNAAGINTYLNIDLLSGTGPQGPPGPTGPSYAAGQMYSLAYYQTIPRPVAGTSVLVTHNLGTTFPLVQLYDSVTLQQIVAQVTVVDANHVSISVTQSVPNPLNIVVMGVAASPVPINPGDYATKAYVATASDQGLLAGTVDLNTVTTPGNYQSAGGNPNGPPIPPGVFNLEVQYIGGGAQIQQRATLVSYPAYIATREYTSGAWQGWRSPAAGMIMQQYGPSPAATAIGQLFTATPSIPVVAGRKYKINLYFYSTNNNAAAGFIYFVVVDSMGVYNTWTNAGGRIAWIGSVPAAQSWTGSASHSFLPTSAGTPTFTLSNNATGSAIGVGVNSCELTLEDMGY